MLEIKVDGIMINGHNVQKFWEAAIQLGSFDSIFVSFHSVILKKIAKDFQPEHLLAI